MTWEHRPISAEKSDAVLHEEYARVVAEGRLPSTQTLECSRCGHKPIEPATWKASGA